MLLIGIFGAPFLFGARRYAAPVAPVPTYSGGDDFGYSDEAQRRASNAGRSALLAGILNSYLNRGEGLGDAFTGMQAARQGVLDREREDARRRAMEERQRRMDESLEAARQAEIENKRIDNERIQAEYEAKRRDAETKAVTDAAAHAAEVERRKALVAEVHRVNPTLASQLATMIDSDKFPVGEAVGAAAPKPREGEHGRWDVDAQGRQVYFPPGGGAPQYRGYIDPSREEEHKRSRVDAEVERRIDDWAAHGLSAEQRYRGLSSVDEEAKRAEIRANVEREWGLQPTAAGGAHTGDNGGRTTTPAGASAEAVTMAAESKATKQLGRALTADEKHDIAEIIRRGGTAAQVYQLLGLK